ncbi:MAG: gluconate 2-dehydrogenase subunit 3 family protein [Cyclobacteriaceae bacterium]|nr:gluconate 2-dehydrogenase subunit 3 family protein [Cyclobacteriaceae bacterium]
MDRRETIKSLFVTSLAGGLVLQSCAPDKVDSVEVVPADKTNVYGRTPEEAKRDKDLFSEIYFTEHEIETIAVLSDIILPSNDSYGSATDAAVPDFVEFMSKDLPYHQLPLRGGIMWLDSQSNKLYNSEFVKCTHEQQISLVDRIAYPLDAKPEMAAGVKFFSLMRNLTLTGYYTTEMGIKDLGYKGNQPNVWDGVPDDVLKEHNLEYDPEWIPKFVDQSKRDVQAQWDDDGNLIS